MKPLGSVALLLGLVMVTLLVGVPLLQKAANSLTPTVGAPSRPKAASRLQPPSLPEVRRLTHSILQALEWRRFELLVSCFYELHGYRTEVAQFGPDGGIDVTLFRADEPQPFAFVQCKAWSTSTVGVKPVRELFGVMAAKRVGMGAFHTTGLFTDEARQFAVGNALELVDGPEFLRRTQTLPEDGQAKLFAVATDGDYTTPTCPSCGVKMLKRTASKGPSAGSTFWGCRNYPDCIRTFSVRREPDLT